MKKPVLIVIAGPNGSGKTSTTRLVIKHEWAEQCVYINPDEIAQSKFGDWNDVNAVRQAVEYCENHFSLSKSYIKVAGFADRAYFYDNSIDNQNAQLLFRTIDGKFAKQYVESFPAWTLDILDSVKE